MDKHDILYDGQRLHWNGHGTFKATSGMPGHQKPRAQCDRDRGPVPEGMYSFSLEEDKTATFGRLGPVGLARIDDEECILVPSHKIQKIPRGNWAVGCEPYFAAWGLSRVRLKPVETKCGKARDGFYIHDSSKGFSRGCIEVETKFFDELRAYIEGMRSRRTKKRNHLYLKVRYVPERETNGGTKVE